VIPDQPGKRPWTVRSKEEAHEHEGATLERHALLGVSHARRLLCARRHCQAQAEHDQ